MVRLRPLHGVSLSDGHSGPGLVVLGFKEWGLIPAVAHMIVVLWDVWMDGLRQLASISS